MEFVVYSEAMKKFLDDNGLAQRFWRNPKIGIDQSLVSRIINGSRKPNKNQMEFIYNEIQRHLNNEYPITYEEFYISPKDQADSYLSRTYNSSFVKDNFNKYYIIADNYSLIKWKVQLSYDYAMYLFKTNHLDDSLRMISGCLGIQNISKELQSKVEYLVGRINYSNKNFLVAIDHLKIAIEFNKENDMAIYYLAVALQYVSRYDEAMIYLIQLIDVSNERIKLSSKVQICYSLMKKCEYEVAVNMLKEIDSNSKLYEVDIKNNLGECYFEMGKYEKAIFYYLISKERAKESSLKRMIRPSLSLLKVYAFTNQYEEFSEVLLELRELKSELNMTVREEMEIVIREILMSYRMQNKNDLMKNLNVLRKMRNEHKLDRHQLFQLKFELLKDIAKLSNKFIGSELIIEIIS